jgi:hypothetical protein
MINSLGIYSFPKSGNTFIKTYMLHALNFQNSYDVFDADKLIPESYDSFYSSECTTHKLGDKNLFIYKSHACFMQQKFGQYDLKNELIVYILRNPLDVFLSQLNYLLKFKLNNFVIKFDSVESIVENSMMDLFLDSFIIFGTLQPDFTIASSWFNNVSYWLELAKDNDNIIILRYEDLVNDFNSAIVPLNNYLALDLNTALRAKDSTDISTAIDDKFYWKKQPKNYLKYLSNEQIKKFNTINEPFLALYGYSII